jgi:hypothetical protein
VTDPEVAQALGDRLATLDPEDEFWSGFILPDGRALGLDSDAEHRLLCQLAGVGLQRILAAGVLRAGVGALPGRHAAAIQAARPLTPAQRATVARMCQASERLYVDVSWRNRRRFSGCADLGRGELADQFALGELLALADAAALRIATHRRAALGLAG